MRSSGASIGRFASMMSTAWSLAAAGAHLMELPAKRRYDAALYVRLHRTLYPNFGKVAGTAEAFAVASTVALAWWVRRRQPAAFRSTAVAATSLMAAHGVFWGVVQPVNVEMMRWPLDAIPRDWTHWRDRWEYGHAVRAGLVTMALGALTWSILTVPRRTSRLALMERTQTAEEEHRIRDAAHDHTLEETFPASDPPSTLPNPG